MDEKFDGKRRAQLSIESFPAGWGYLLTGGLPGPCWTGGEFADRGRTFKALCAPCHCRYDLKQMWGGAARGSCAQSARATWAACGLIWELAQKLEGPFY